MDIQGQSARRAAQVMVSRIMLSVNRLAIPGLAYMGRPGLVAGTRELLEPPYIIVYRVDDQAEQVVVLGILHGARQRDDS